MKKGTIANYIPMEEISSNNRYAHAVQKRAYNGGARFINKDVIFARITPCLQNRKIAQYVSESEDIAYGSTEYFVFRSIPDVSDPSYIYYLLRSDFVVEPAIKSMKGASGRQRALIEPILDLELNIPKYQNQVKIGELLSAYDNLIENNNQRIAILEEMAQKLYREWFVHFRFSGHENVKMVESELGLIPEGWRFGTVGDISTKIFSGGTPTTSIDEYWNGIYSWLSSGETNIGYITETDKKITELGIDNSSTRLANRFDIVVASAGQGKTRGQTSLLLLDTYINQSVISIRAKSDYALYAFYNIRGRYDELRHISDASSIRGSLTTAIFNTLPILIPEVLIVQEFDKIAVFVAAQIENLLLRNTNLRKTRDLLIPALINGDIDVSDLPIQVKED